MINDYVRVCISLFDLKLFYQVDGFRFDLMGHLMKSTMVCNTILK